MPPYRLYRSVVAGATGRVGEALTRQLLRSPLCSEVHVVGRSNVDILAASSAADGGKAKLRCHSADLAKPLAGVDASALAGVDVAFCLLGARGGWTATADVAAVERDGAVRFAQLCEAAKVPHISLLSSAWADSSSRLLAFARAQGEAADEYASMTGFQRVSIFLPSALTDEDGRPFVRDGAPMWARTLWGMVPVAVQLMPTRFRQASLADVVLALRLNVELCDATERVERLGFREMMQIIGRENEV